MPRMGTDSREAFKTFENVFDRFTERNLWKLISKGTITGLVGPVSQGKEANVFLAEAPGDRKVIVKIYRLSTCDFKTMYKFIRTDPRFPHLNRQRRKVIFAWAQREYRNLFKARDAGLRVPTPLDKRKNILVMEMIGDKAPAPKAKDVEPEDPEAFIEDIIIQMRLYHQDGMVHGDLSPFNILNDDGKPVFIDFSQSTTLDDPNAEEYLQRDIKNISQYAEKLGIKLTEEELRNRITNRNS